MPLQRAGGGRRRSSGAANTRRPARDLFDPAELGSAAAGGGIVEGGGGFVPDVGARGGSPLLVAQSLTHTALRSMPYAFGLLLALQ